jgi:hypothetical protein
MSKVVKELREKLELALNTIDADQVVLRLILESLILNMATRVGTSFIADLKEQVLGSIERASLDRNAPELAERRRQLTFARADLLFQELEDSIRIPQAMARTGRPN